MADEFECPYTVGNVIKIHLKTPNGLEATEDAKIIKVFEPFTFSYDLLHFEIGRQHGLGALPSAIRNAGSKVPKIQPWTQEREAEYHRFILDGGAREFMSQLNDDESSEGSPWSPAMDETYLQDKMSDYYKAEVRAYNHMKGIQGTDVPQLLASAIMCAPVPFQHSTEFVDIPGILLQHIEGFPLTDISEFAPRESWQSICEDAIRIVNVIGDLGILNKDVKTRSFIVRSDLKGGFKMTMIDFGLCRFRQDCKDAHNWDQWKSYVDEEGAVGRVMEKRLKGGFLYRRSARYEDLDDRFRQEWIDWEGMDWEGMY